MQNFENSEQKTLAFGTLDCGRKPNKDRIVGK